ncbi:histone deacetylase family protein [Psychrobium sp. 1_MG-2023]|uniref:histone deacetylase family protein n=1 Tax=Psychrobium sp. 1_MG-2023 TaxID=3062624 RepID=UPI000C32AFB4|nr:histone deacetylase family protein [Psychrobium sp. 1_MG-2023]MDP2562018.1 histone deacetylase family protein [Psychrobium sp. 1_MG-2023]PKF58505.1 deacetylase [Alteromonadales bacterium alter-6D02]
MSTAIISHFDCRRHKMTDGHPEDPARIDAVSDRLIASGLEYSLDHFDAKPVNKADLLRVHDSLYLAELEEMLPSEGLVNVDADTQMCPNTLKAAVRSAGAGVQAVDLVYGSDHKAVFCNVRPPGHHAERAKAGGFCFYNNIAVAAAYALEKLSLERVAIVDFDVHHGNGTEDIFRDNDQVMFCSAFQHPLFPYSDISTPNPLHIKAPLKAGAGSQEFRNAVEEYWLPALREFKPQLLFISAGFDAHRDDDMAEMNLEDSDYSWVTGQLVDLSHELNCEGIVSMLEGGYVPDALGRSVVAHVRSLAGL